MCRKYIKEHKTAIDILLSMTAYKDRFAEIDKRYEKIIPIIFSEKIEFSVACNYAKYLADQNRGERAIEIAEKLKDEYMQQEDKTEAFLSWIYNFLGNCYSDRNIQSHKAEAYYLKAIEIRESLARENPERFNPDLATSFFNYAIFTGNDSYFEKAFELAKTRPDHPICKQIIVALTK